MEDILRRARYRRVARAETRFLPHLTLFCGALLAGAGIATAVIGFHQQSNDLLYYGKVMFGIGTGFHIVSFMLHFLD